MNADACACMTGSGRGDAALRSCIAVHRARRFMPDVFQTRGFVE
jgi:hypothetical protein